MLFNSNIPCAEDEMAMCLLYHDLHSAFDILLRCLELLDMLQSGWGCIDFLREATDGGL